MLKYNLFKVCMFLGLFVSVNILSQGWYDRIKSFFSQAEQSQPVIINVKTEEDKAYDAMMRVHNAMIRQQCGYDITTCGSFLQGVQQGSFDAVINNFINSPNSPYGKRYSLLSYLLGVYLTNVINNPDQEILHCLEQLIFTVRQRGGRVVSLDDYTLYMNDEIAFQKLQSTYRLITDVQKGQQSIEQHQKLLARAHDCKELARLFYSGDPLDFQKAFMQVPEYIENAISEIASLIQEQIKRNPAYKNVLVEGISNELNRIDSPISH